MEVSLVRSRKLSETKGRRAERLAAFWLRLKAYRIVKTRYRTPKGEIDLVARRGRHIAFVEVKARPSLAQGKEAIHERQQRRIKDAAHHWLMEHPCEHFDTASFDAVIIVPYRLPVHIKQAFDLSPTSSI